MLELCYVVIQIAEMFTGIWIVHSLYEELKKNPAWLRGIWSIMFILLCILYAENARDSFISNAFILVHSALLSLWYCVGFKASFLRVFLIEMLYMTSISFLKLPVLIWEGMLSGASLSEVNRGCRTLFECVWCFTLVVIIALIIKKKVFFTHYKKPVQLLIFEYRKLMLVVTGIQWFLLSYNMWLGMQGFQAIDLSLSVILICSIFLSLHYLVIRMAYYEVKLDNERLDFSQGLLQKQNEELHEMYKKNSVRMHEYSHNLEYLYYCIKEKKYIEAENYLHKYLDGLKEEKRVVWTGLPFLDFVINYKKQAIDKRGIVFHLNLDIYEYPFEEEELGILLGNLLDNAIEACEKCEPEKREINLGIWNVKCMFMLNLVNSSSKCPEMKERQFITDKKDKNAHGMGVEQVRRIVDKYGGDIDFQYSGGHFETSIIVSNIKEANA